MSATIAAPLINDRLPDRNNEPDDPESSLPHKPSTLKVQAPDNHILAQNLYYNYYFPKAKYLIIGYLDSLGNSTPKNSACAVGPFSTLPGA